MKPTVEQGLTARAIEADHVLEALNKEVVPILDSARAAANFRSAFKITGDTSDSVAAYKPIWESDQVPNAGTWSIEAHVVFADSNSDGAAYYLAAMYRMVAGVPTPVGSTALVSQESNGAFDWQWSTTATSVILSVRDAGVAASYAVVIEVLEVVP